MNIGLLLAAGKGERFKEDKAFVLLNGKPVIFHSLKFLEESPYVDEIFIAVNKDNKKKVEGFVKKSEFKKVKKIFLGGPSRFISVTKVLPHVLGKKKLDYLVIHNVANPLATREELDRCFKALTKGVSGVAVGRKIHSTIKKATGLSWEAPVVVDQTVPRQNLWEVETPQVVRAKDFLEACKSVVLRQAQDDTFDFTDDLSVLEARGKKTLIVGASNENRKLTRPEDIELLRFFAGGLPSEYAFGIGEDSHRFKLSKNEEAALSLSPFDFAHGDPEFIEGSKGGPRYHPGLVSESAACLVLGGVKIPTLPALSANSDGDVILHALCNAISSVLGGGSLGTYATKMCQSGIRDSKKYLKIVLKKMAIKKYKVYQCSISIEAKKPNIDKITLTIKNSLSNLLGVPSSKIGITATTGNGTTVFGHVEGIKCCAAVVLSVSPEL
jgi:2-C-methyl-D-erythritol 4-phosphate cytidylyltransferase/2-C-methyl-D-erythritol 2,4-cyclodiphosphate synthase